MLGLILSILILFSVLILGYVYRKELRKLWNQHKKKIIAFILGTSIAAGGLVGVPDLELNIEDYLIDELSDYKELGFNISKIINPYLYESEVLCEGHLPLAFEFSTLSKDVSVTDDFITISKSMEKNMETLDLTYKILINETFTYDIPIYKIVYNDVVVFNNTTMQNETVKEKYEIVDYYKEIQDYRYVWKNFNSKTLKQGDVVVIDIIGNFKASTESKRVDIIPTLNLESYSKTYDKYAWWNSNWNYKKEITINHSQVEGIVTNFPVCINITDTDLRDNAQSDGDDIAFTNGDEDTQLHHEIEYWDNTTGKIVSWVNVTSISSSVDTSIYMYYGNDAAANQEDVTNTWHGSYDAVYHFYEGEGTSVNDSTSNNHDGTLDFSDHWVTHNFGYAYDFDGTDDECEVSWKPDYGSTNSVCIMAYTKSDDVTNFQTVAGWAEYAVSNEELNIFFNDEELRLRIRDSDNDAIRMDYAASDSTSYYTVGVINRSTDKLCQYINGAVTVSDSSNIDQLIFDDNFGIGESFGNNQGKNMNGIIDEVRVYNGLLNRSYIITSYNTMNNAVDGEFFSIGAEQTEPVSCECLITSVLPVNNTGSSIALLNLSADVNTTCGTLDYVNISITNDTGYLYYTNTTPASNGSFYLNESWSGFTDCTVYKWYLNTSCDGEHNHTQYNVQITECECLVTNILPINNTEQYLTLLNLSADINADGCGCDCPSCIDYVNISITNDTGHLFYNNITNTENDTFYLDETWTGLTNGTDYIWYVNVSCNGSANHTWYNFTALTGTISYANISNDGYDYFCWKGDNETLLDVAATITNFDEEDEFIAVWNASNWTTNEGCWIKYYGDGSGTNANVNQYDVVYSYLTDSGKQTISMPSSLELPDCNRVVALRDLGMDVNKGYNYTCYCCGSIDLSVLANDIGLQTGEVLSWWDNTTQEWESWVVGISTSTYDATINVTSPIIETKVENDYDWVINCP